MRWKSPANSMMPAYRDGDVIVVSPAAPIRRGDRVVVKTKDGEVMVKELKRRTSKTIELRSLNPRTRSARCRCATCCGSRASSGRASESMEPISHGKPSAISLDSRFPIPDY